MSARIAPLVAANDLFHDAYRGAQDGVRNQVPILVVLPTELSLHHHEARKRLLYSRPIFDRAKAAAHIAVALFAYTAAESKRAEAREGTTRLLRHISAALDASERSEPNHELDALLKRCLTFAEAARE